MTMRLIILGSGTGTPLSDRGSPCLLLMCGGEYSLLDIGPGSLRQLTRIGVPHERVSRIFITHFHPDHTADLVHFLFATRNPDVLARRAPFSFIGARGLREFVRQIQRPYGRWLQMPPGLMHIEELDDREQDGRRFGAFSVRSQPLDHTPQSLAYRIQDGEGRSFVYSGDTGYQDELCGFADRVDLLILECSFPEGKEGRGHLTPARAGRVATMAKAKRLLLLHFFPEVLATDIQGESRKTYSGELTLGQDFMHVQI
ncbi:MAG: MBL fold metallo-hydrolase [Thermodesulfobacteriota bacterium]